MKKLFFFRSSSNTNGSDHPSPQPSADNEVYWEKPFDKENADPANSDNKVRKSFRCPQSLFSKSQKQPSADNEVYWEKPFDKENADPANSDNKVRKSFRCPQSLLSKSQKQTFESENSGNSSGIRRSRSLSLAVFQRNLGEQMDFSSFDGQMKSPHGSSSAKPLQQSGHRSSRCRSVTPKCQNETKIFQLEAFQNLPEFERPGSAERYKSEEQRLQDRVWELSEKNDILKGEVEQLQAGYDILSCEVQNAMDNLSCASYKLKDFELQILKKDENMSRMQSNFEESSKELIMTKGILSKVSQDRDMMWEEVKQYSEKNMLLNKEVAELKKKIETLGEAILVREGEMEILKDTLGRRPFNLLSSPDSTREFLMN